MPWYLHLALILGPIVLIALLFLFIHILTLVTGKRGHAPGWQVRCTRCECVRDANEVGMVRVAAATTSKCVLGYCRACHGLRWLAVERKSEQAG